MNVHRIIEEALEGNDDITLPNQADQEFCSDDGVMKLASALNFIGNNLESAVPSQEEILAQAELLSSLNKEANLKNMTQKALSFAQKNPEAVGAIAGGTAGAGVGAMRAEKGERLKGALIGGSVGAGTGALAGYGVRKLSPGSNTASNTTGMIREGKPLSAEDASKLSRKARKRAAKRFKQSQAQAKQAGYLGDIASKFPHLMKEAEYDRLGQASDAAFLGSVLAGGIGAHRGKKMLKDEGFTDEEIDNVLTRTGGATRGLGKGIGYGFAGNLVGEASNRLLDIPLSNRNAGKIGEILGMGVGGVRSYKGEMNKARRAIAKNKKREKTASVDDVLYHAAQVGKKSLLEKVAEDRINPAKISAGPADPYSGEIMPNPGKVSSEFIGNTRDHHALIALKAQKVRDRINKDMKQYVSNVGDGYNLKGHLSKMNK